MADYFTQLSSRLDIPKGKEEKAQKIIDREIEAMYEEDGYCTIVVQVVKELMSCHVWFQEDESAETDQVEKIARALIEELEIDTPFICSFAYICSKPIIDSFGGGAFGIKRGQETYWKDAFGDVVNHFDK